MIVAYRYLVPVASRFRGGGTGTRSTSEYIAKTKRVKILDPGLDAHDDITNNLCIPVDYYNDRSCFATEQAESRKRLRYWHQILHHNFDVCQ